MSKLLLVLTAGAMFAACSAPKYTYYFDRHPVKSMSTQAESQEGAKGKNVVSGKRSRVIPEIITTNASITIQEQKLVASISKEMPVRPTKKPAIVHKDYGTSLLEITMTDKKGLVKAVKEFKSDEKSIS